VASEAERVRAVYRHYAADPHIVAKWSAQNFANTIMWEEVTGAIPSLMSENGIALGEAAVLDAGCGLGSVLGRLAREGARPGKLYGVDLLEERISQARAAYPQINFSCADARHLEFPNHFFDVILSINLFGSILDDTVAEAVAGELQRVVKPTGLIIWSDLRYRNPQNPDVRGYGRTKIQKLFPGCRLRLRPITVVPPLARRLGRMAPALYPVLARVPFLCVRHFGTIRPVNRRPRAP
jgi:2-polyprenyl-3-methyl-5-hydroxy-6-metoxy-1,4-benzoquinol methylase